MATKSQLKQYFETGKIPTQAQFGELIDFVQPFITENVTDRPNQTLRFGEDGTKPIVNGLRIVHYRDDDDSIFNFWLFTNASNDNNEAGIAVPVFAILRITNIAPGIPSGNDKLRYFIPEAEHITAWVQQGVDCDTAPDADIFNALQNWPFKDWSEGDGSNPLRVYKYSNAQTETIYNVVFEEQTIFGINGVEYTIPVCIKTIGNYPYANSQGIYMIETVDALNQIETAWNAFKDNFDNTDFSQVNSFISSYYIKISNNIE
jgi:hypothetical protein